MLDFCVGLSFGVIIALGVVFTILSQNINRRTSGYQPDGHNGIDWSRPPRGGSGVPSKQ